MTCSVYGIAVMLRLGRKIVTGRIEMLQGSGGYLSVCELDKKIQSALHTTSSFKFVELSAVPSATLLYNCNRPQVSGRSVSNN